MRACARCGRLVSPAAVINAASPLLRVTGWTVRTKMNAEGANYHLVEADIGTVFCGPMKPMKEPERRTP